MWFIVPILTLLGFIRIYVVISRPRKKLVPRESNGTCSLAVFLGSGGHTSEALSLMSALDFSRYSPRIYVVGEGDTLSVQKALSLEAAKSSSEIRPNSSAQYKIITIPRARKVRQPVWTTFATALLSLCICVHHVTITPFLTRSRGKFADALLINGPGTCFILCLAVYLNKFLGLPHPQVIYVESFARVQSLSFSGRLLRPVVDRFIVQWPELLRDGRGGECHGTLV